MCVPQKENLNSFQGKIAALDLCHEALVPDSSSSDNDDESEGEDEGAKGATTDDEVSDDKDDGKGVFKRGVMVD